MASVPSKRLLYSTAVIPRSREAASRRTIQSARSDPLRPSLGLLHRGWPSRASVCFPPPCGDESQVTLGLSRLAPTQDLCGKRVRSARLWLAGYRLLMRRSGQNRMCLGLMIELHGKAEERRPESALLVQVRRSAGAFNRNALIGSGNKHGAACHPIDDPDFVRGGVREG